MKNVVRIFGCVAITILLTIGSARAATMNDYCVVPPFIQEIAKPNLLMIIDNSASMNDLAYDDTGYSCSTTTSKACTANTDCPSGETCTQLRTPSYCYDSSFSSAKSYTGYFDNTKNYQYNFTTSRFQEVASIPASCAMAAVADAVYCKLIANTLHLNINKTDATATKYLYASGKLLNWLTASKFDVEKQVLTGGKYVTKVCSHDSSVACVADSDCGTGNTCSVSVSAFLQPESRGCVGMGYVKNLNTADFVNYATGATNPNTSLGLTILVKGPQNPNNPVSPSTGGQTYLEFYTKTGASYDYQACQDAVTAIATAAGTGQVASAVDNCLASSGTTLGQCQQNTSLGCLSSYGPTSPNCDFPVKTPNPYCLSDSSRSCSVASQLTDCTIIGASTCTAGKANGTACTVNSDCDFKGCSALTTRSCSGASDCVKTEKGYCSLKPSKTCTTDANCSVSNDGTCIDKPYDYGTCGLVTSGTCAATGGDLYVGPCKTDASGYLGPCVLTSQQAETKTKTAFTHSMQACWALRKNGTPIGHDEFISVRNECSDIYGNYKTCSNDRFQTCSVNADCGAGNTCLTGPAAIQPGNPGLICSNSFEGLLFARDGVSGAWVLRSSLPASIPDACASGDSVEQCGIKLHTDFCNQMDSPPVTDPTNPPSAVVETENLPAILSGIGVEAQLGKPIFNAIPVKVETASAPSGLVQEFANKIRIGLMVFNTYGSASETSATEPLPAGKLAPTTVCSNDSTKVCIQNIDCGTGNSCVNATDLDGAKIRNLIGIGHCSNSVGTTCTKSAHCTSPGVCLTSYCSTTKSTSCTQDTNCPSGETCINYAGSHATSGLVSSIDLLKGATWTPFAEAFYNAIGYYAINSADSSGKTSRTALRINSADYPDAMNPSEYVCQANNILLVTDGSSTADQNSSMTGLVDVYKSVSGNVTGTCTKYAGSQDLDDLAWLGRQRNINSFSTSSASTAVPLKKNEQITTYVVFNGSDNGETGDCNNTTLLTKTANNGGTSLLKTDIPDQYKATLRRAFESVAGGTASGTAASILSNSEGSGANILQAVFYPTKDFETVSGSTVPTSASWIGEMQNLWYYVDPYIGNSSVREDTNKDKSLHIVNDYVAEFQFKGGETIATLKNDTDGNGSGDTNAIDPRVISQGYCTNTTTPSISTNSKCADNTGCVSPETCSMQGIVNTDDINSLWRAGKQLWNRDLSSSPRKLYTYLYGTSVTAPAFCGSGTLTFSANAMVDLVTLNYLDPSDNTWKLLTANDRCIITALLQASSVAEAGAILKFAHGYDSPDTANINGVTPRKRTVAVARKNADGTKIYDALGKVVSDSKVWKLGDIIASTPRVQSFNKLNNFHQDAPLGYSDMTYADDTIGKGFTNSAAYKARGMAYAGANDGMMHAFKLGSLAVNGSKVVTTEAGTDVTVNVTGQTKAALGGTGLGEEQWAFVPKNVLPYLKYLADPAYSHLYLVDGPTKLIDASIGYNDNSYIPAAVRSVYTTAGCDATGSGDHTKYWACKKDSATESNKSWRTILIGSMGIGGASNNLGTSCSTCVKTPVSDVGYSSYFALDITDPAAPKYLWEFSDPLMGFATSGVAVARVRHDFIDTTTTPETTYKDTNGRWFAVIGNGPSGPIDTTYHQFKGKSRNPLRVFVLDLKTGVLLKRFLDSSKDRSFVGQMSSAPIDTDRSKPLSDGYYSDDALYFGYTDCTDNCSATDESPTWDGGIMRLLTNENVDPSGPVDDATSNWSLSTFVSGIGPVTTAVGKLQDRKNHKLWLYTGSGRYFYKGDVSASAGKILGIKEPCYSAVNDDIYSLSAINGQSIATRCTNTISFGAGADFADQSNGASLNTVDDKKGWFIPLESEDTTNHYGAERVITEPVTTPNGAVFFTSFMPSTDICNYGGNSYMWGMRYDTGGAASTGQLQGKALVQVSTGAFEEVNLSTALSARDGRKMATPMVGKPPTDPPPIVSSSGNKPLKRILHIQEK